MSGKKTKKISTNPESVNMVSVVGFWRVEILKNKWNDLFGRHFRDLSLALNLLKDKQSGMYFIAYQYRNTKVLSSKNNALKY